MLFDLPLRLPNRRRSGGARSSKEIEGSRTQDARGGIFPTPDLHALFSSPLSWLLLNRYREEPSGAREEAHYHTLPRRAAATAALSLLLSLRPAHISRRTATPGSLVGPCPPSPCWRAACWLKEREKREKVHTAVVVTVDLIDCANNNHILAVSKCHPKVGTSGLFKFQRYVRGFDSRMKVMRSHFCFNYMRPYRIPSQILKSRLLFYRPVEVFHEGRRG